MEARARSHKGAPVFEDQHLSRLVGYVGSGVPVTRELTRTLKGANSDVGLQLSSEDDDPEALSLTDSSVSVYMRVRTSSPAGGVPFFTDMNLTNPLGYVGPGTPVIRQLTREISKNGVSVTAMRADIRGGSLASKVGWVQGVHLEPSQGSITVMRVNVRGGTLANRTVWMRSEVLGPRSGQDCGGSLNSAGSSCTEKQVRACDSAGCRCVDTGVAPQDPYGNLAIDILAGGFSGPVRGLLGRLITTRGVSVAISRSFARAIPLQASYVGENVAGNSLGWLVKYLSPSERLVYKLTLRNGKFYDASGKLFDTAAASTAHSGAGRAIFVVDELGNIYASIAHQVGRFHHSSFLSGGPVLTAGEMQIQNGVLRAISNKSGHYRPAKETVETLLGVMRETGVDVVNITKDLI